MEIPEYLKQQTLKYHRLGIDIGGTFTDAILIDEETGAVCIRKVPSTPEDPSIGFLDATRRIIADAGIAPIDIRSIVHGTTVATNAIIETKTARTGFVTTNGFRDMLEIGRQTRPELYNLRFKKIPPLVPRDLCFEVPERLDAQGNVIVSIDENAVRDVAKCLKEADVEAIAVCFLHSYIEPTHEQRAGEILRELLPGVLVTLSSELAPEIREYFRASTTVVNAAISPIVESYLGRIEEGLSSNDIDPELLVMQSNGGIFTFRAAKDRPVFMVESGPAAGVVAASNLGARLDLPNVLSLDMGGTTAKAGLVQDGNPVVTKEYEVGSTAVPGTGSSRGSGYPIRTPVIDLVEIGAGGGSIAWIDSGGALRVGPRSAGADPGPVCYGSGGHAPTVTDANLVLGRLNPTNFLGGEIQLDVDLARNAIYTSCALPLGMGIEETALGIIEIANSAMVNALRIVSVQRGYDPREFALVAFGGAGPVHACRLADEMDISTTVIPLSPGTTSALGLLVTDLAHEFSNTLMHRIDEVEPDSLEHTLTELEAQGKEALRRESLESSALIFRRQGEMRYVGQSFELPVPISGKVNQSTIEGMVDSFHKGHEQAYGHSARDEPIELVNVRVTAIQEITKPQPIRLQDDTDKISQEKPIYRPVYFSEHDGDVETKVIDRTRLGAGAVILGPALIEEIDSTTVIHPEWIACVDNYGNLIISPDEPR